MAKIAQLLDLSPIGDELDKMSFENLEERYPELSRRIVEAMDAGAEPAAIRRYVLSYGMSTGWANWLEQAARAAAGQVQA